jgi:hypothetical protein
LRLGAQFSGPLRFTLRFKPEAGAQWLWSKEQNGLEDGLILFQTPATSAAPFNTLFQNSGADIVVRPVVSQVSGVDVFDVTAAAPPMSNGSSIAVLGDPLALELFYSLVSLTVSVCHQFLTA